MIQNFFEFNLPLADTYRHLGESLTVQHLWFGIYAFQNMIIAGIIRLFNLKFIPFKYIYICFGFVINFFFVFSGTYLLIKKISNNRFVIFYGLLFICFFSYFQIFPYSIQYLNVFALAPFLYYLIIDFFCFKPSGIKIVLILSLSGLVLFIISCKKSKPFLCAA